MGQERGRGFRPEAVPGGERTAEVPSGPVGRERGGSHAPTSIGIPAPLPNRDRWMEHLADVRKEVHQVEDRLDARLVEVEVAVAADSVAVGASGPRREAEERRLWRWVYAAIFCSCVSVAVSLPALVGVLVILFFGRHS